MDAEAWRIWSKGAPYGALREFSSEEGGDSALIDDKDIPQLLRQLRAAGVRSVTFHLEDDELEGDD